LVTNRDGVLVLYNPAAARYLCLHERDLLGQSVAECLPHPALTDMFREVLAPGADCDMLVREFPTGEDGRVLMANVAPVRDEGGEKLGAVAVLSDISELKALDRAKSQFVSMVSHELRAPLAAIEGYLSLLLGGLVRDDPQEQQLMLARARERAQALLGLIDDLSDISRIEAGQIAKQVRLLNVADVVREVLILLRPEATARSVALHDDLPPELAAMADREDLVRIFTNLVSNAIKYNRPEGEVRVAGRIEGAYVRVDVADTGLGIPSESLDRIFDEFYRVKCKETAGIDGTGLGLHIARRLVESYHGSIRVMSELGKGSTFSVILPRGESETQWKDAATSALPGNERA
jgi:PAS domain S-box-containing protein